MDRLFVKLDSNHLQDLCTLYWVECSEENNVKQASQKKLNSIVDKGFWHYVLVYGVVSWGLSTAILYSLFQHFFGTPQTLASFAMALLVFAVGGLGWGAVMWRMLVRQLKPSDPG